MSRGTINNVLVADSDMFSKASLVLFVTLVAAVAASVIIPPLLQEAFVECSITVSDEALRGAMKYYKCGDFRHLLTDPVFRGPKSGAAEFESCFIDSLRMPKSMTIDNNDLETVIKELKCNPGPMPSDGAQRPESLLSKIGSRFRQLQQRYGVQFDEIAKKVKPEWIKCFNAHRNVSIQELLCDKDRVEMNRFKHCILGNNQDLSATMPSEVPSRLQKITDWIVGKVICNPEPSNARINRRSTFSETVGDLADVLPAALGALVLLALCGWSLAILVTILPWQLLASVLAMIFLPFVSMLVLMGLADYIVGDD